ncbi:MAG: dynamin family protein [Anaerolineae bacterium]|nr:dynamin family protein [Anaerolineae bacterium]
MLYRFLTEADERILQAERSQLVTLRRPLAALDADSDDMAQLDRAILQLDELFLLVVVGEFNAGKSAFINALLGQHLLPEGVTPTTTQVTVLRHGEAATPGGATEVGEMALLSHPIEWLHDINIVDTPGTNAIIRRHQEITEEFVPRADLILFVTSADRPFSESERLFLQRIREWGKKIVFVVNKIDILETAADVDRIVAFVETNGRELLGRKPVIFPISARLAQRAKETFDADERTRAWAGSRFERLEDYILHTLDEGERLRLKLANPLGVALLLTERYLGLARARQELLKDDIATIRTVEAQLAAYERDMRRDFKYHLSHVDNVLYGMAERGNRFFDETIRLSRILDLINADRIQGLFEREVVADTAAQIEAHTLELIDWIVAQEFKEWQDVTEYLGRRAARHADQMIGPVSGIRGFELHRQALLESVGQAVRAAVATYDRNAEARALAESVQIAVAETAIVEVGAIGLGALLVKVLAVTVADVTGLLAAGAVAALGLYVIPARRRRAQKDLQEKITTLRARLSQALTEQFEAELGRSLARIREAMRPYTRFIETQQTTLDESQAALREAQGAMAALKAQIEAI